MKIYTVTTTENLRKLCIDNNWFTCGTNRQYEKLFYANENRCPIEEITTIIWLCSDDEVTRRDILDALRIARIEYYATFFNITFGRLFRFWNKHGVLLECTFGHFCDVLTDPEDEEWNFDSVVRVERKRPYGRSELIWSKEGEE